MHETLKVPDDAYANWEEVKLKHKKKQCVICGSKDKLHLHHHTYDGENSVYKTLCERCHEAVHFDVDGNMRSSMRKVRETFEILFANRRVRHWPKKRPMFNLTTEQRYSGKFTTVGYAKHGSCRP